MEAIPPACRGICGSDATGNDEVAHGTGRASAGARDGTSKFYHGDYLNSITRETDSSQATTATKQYDAFGMPLSSTGSSASPFGFAGCFGYQEDGDSGLNLLGHRYYDPSTGRFLTRDPAKDGRNWYGYCWNNPCPAVDPQGLGTDVLHTILGIAGVLDPTGICDGLDAAIYLFEGDYANAAISAVGAIPFGDIFKAGRFLSRGLHLGGEAFEGAAAVARKFSSLSQGAFVKQLERVTQLFKHEGLEAHHIIPRALFGDVLERFPVAAKYLNSVENAIWWEAHSHRTQACAYSKILRRWLEENVEGKFDEFCHFAYDKAVEMGAAGR